jgi:hypothetical protein
MAAWAYQCFLCGDSETTYFVPCEVVNEFPAAITIVHVKVGNAWLCASVDRLRPVEIAEGMLLRQVAPSDAASCTECEDGQRGRDAMVNL